MLFVSRLPLLFECRPKSRQFAFSSLHVLNATTQLRPHTDEFLLLHAGAFLQRRRARLRVKPSQNGAHNQSNNQIKGHIHDDFDCWLIVTQLCTWNACAAASISRYDVILETPDHCTCTAC